MAAKQLILMRHGHAQTDAVGQEDHGRSLSEKGRGQCRRIAAEMRRYQIMPQLAYVSSARRTQETAQILRESDALAEEAAIEESRLYLAPTGELLHTIQQAPPEIDRLMIIGHNPGLHQLALLLLPAEMYGPLSLGLPPAGLVHLSLDQALWEEITPASAQLEQCLTT